MHKCGLFAKLIVMLSLVSLLVTSDLNVIEDEVRKMSEQSLPTQMHAEHDTYSSFTLSCAARMASYEQVLSDIKFDKDIHSYNATTGRKALR